MRKNLPFWGTLILSLAALVASAMLLVEYVKPQPVFCDPEGGCGMLKRTVLAYPFGIPMPVFGISGLFAIALAALLEGRRARIIQAVLSCLGAVVAAGLLFVQAKLDTFCPYCVVVDVSVLLIAALSVARLIRGWEPPDWKLLRRSSVVAVVLAIVVPVGIGAVKKPLPTDLPPAIARELAATPHGVVTIVDFVDFECPYCRMTHTELLPLLESSKGRIRVVRVNVPLSIHPHAKDAARAAICGELLGKADVIADALFAADPNDLTPDGTTKIAEGVGLDPEKFRQCLTSPAVAARLESDKETWLSVHGHGLPTLWIGPTKLEGAQDRATLRAAFEAALGER